MAFILDNSNMKWGWSQPSNSLPGHWAKYGSTMQAEQYEYRYMDCRLQMSNKKFGSELEKHLLDGVKPQMSLPVCDKSLC